MQPVVAIPRPARMLLRAIAALGLAVGLLVAPAATVNACSCAGLGGPIDIAKQAAADADLAFIGTVVEAGPGPADPDGFGPTVTYAFAVERVTAPVAAVIEVQTLDDPGGASCGFAFGLDETWFVTSYEHQGVLQTGLCSGNTELETLGELEQDQLSAMLTLEPIPMRAPADEIPWLPIAGIALGILAVGAVMVVAFRRDA
jgi:hypothetical protein